MCQPTRWTACLAFSSCKETPFAFDSQHRSACGRHYILVSIPLIAAVQYETEQEQSRADVSFCSSGAIHHRGRTEHRAVARSDLDRDQGRGDYCLPASNNARANWAQGCSLTPLRAGNVRSAKDLKRPALRWLCQNTSRWPERLDAHILFGCHEDAAEPLHTSTC